MNLRDLKYLLSVAEHQHFGKAAEACFVSQPTLSAQLKKLEDELGVQIFERNNKKVLITRAGEALIAQASVIMNEVKQLQALAQYGADPRVGEFRLGAIPTLGPYLFPHIINDIREQFPQLELFLQEDKTDTILKQLKVGELDAIILALPVADEGCHVEYLFDEPFYLAVPQAHRLSKRKKLHIDDLHEETILLLADGHCLRDQALQVCQLAGAIEKSRFRATSLETLRSMVAIGSGITFLPSLAVDDAGERQGNTHILPFYQPTPMRQIGMLWRQSSARANCCIEMAELVKRLIAPFLQRHHKMIQMGSGR